ncbi:MAG TPA: hypothetical protein VGG33_27375 [Polyangia bacterium]
MPFLSILSASDHVTPARGPRHRVKPATLTLLLVSVVLALCFAPRPVQAQQDQRDAQARAHYESGVQLFDAGDYEGAYRQFEAGHQLSGRPKFLVSMAHAQRRRGHLHDAVRLYQQYLSLVSDSPLQAQVKRELRRLEASLDEQRRRQHFKGGANDDSALADAEPAAPRRARYAGRADDGDGYGRRSRSRARNEAEQVEPAPAPASRPIEITPPPPPPSPATLAKAVTAKESDKQRKSTDLIIEASDSVPTETVAKPYYKRPWFWVAVAAGVVATGAVAATQLVPKPVDNGSTMVIGTLGAPVQ